MLKIGTQLMQRCIGTGVTLLALSTASVQAGPLAVGDLAPQFEVTTLTGESFKLQDYAGKKPVYLKFWATWCSYCKVEMPHLQSIENEYGDDIEVLAVNVGMNDSVANIQKFYNSGGFNLPTIIDSKGDLTSRYGIVGTPHHVLIDRDGRIAYRTFLATDQLDSMIEDWSDQSSDTSKGKTLAKVAEVQL